MFVCISENENIENGLNLFFLKKKDYLPFSLVQFPMVFVHSDRGFCTFRNGFCTFRLYFLTIGSMFCTFGFCTLGSILCTLGLLIYTIGSIIRTFAFNFSTNGGKLC